jgi:hypothetical protein
MMLVGTSFGGCLKSLMAGEVSEDDVLVIITRTAFKDYDGLMRVVEQYHNDGNKWATKPGNYELSEFDLDEVKELAHRLYEHGKIHQPRLNNNFQGFVHPEMTRDEVWLEIAPKATDAPAVVNAYNQYKMLVMLTRTEHEHQR